MAMVLRAAALDMASTQFASMEMTFLRSERSLRKRDPCMALEDGGNPVLIEAMRYCASSVQMPDCYDDGSH